MTKINKCKQEDMYRDVEKQNIIGKINKASSRIKGNQFKKIFGQIGVAQKGK